MIRIYMMNPVRNRGRFGIDIVSRTYYEQDFIIESTGALI